MSDDPTDWQTCAVTVLPYGWVNVFGGQVFAFDHDDENGGLRCTSHRVEHCPAILVQEQVTVFNASCVEGVPWTERITRTVYATGYRAGGELRPARDVVDYYRTCRMGIWEALRDGEKRRHLDVHLRRRG